MYRRNQVILKWCLWSLFDDYLIFAGTKLNKNWLQSGKSFGIATAFLWDFPCPTASQNLQTSQKGFCKIIFRHRTEPSLPRRALLQVLILNLNKLMRTILNNNKNKLIFFASVALFSSLASFSGQCESNISFIA